MTHITYCLCELCLSNDERYFQKMQEIGKVFFIYNEYFRQRDKLEDMLRTLTTDRTKIGELMRWAIDHAEYAEEVRV